MCMKSCKHDKAIYVQRIKENQYGHIFECTEACRERQIQRGRQKLSLVIYVQKFELYTRVKQVAIEVIGSGIS